jgi:hypothetical protein
MIVPGVIVNDIRLFNIVKLRFHWSISIS